MHRIFDVLMLALIVALFMVMMRPGSLGPKLAEVVGKAFVDIIKAATGGGTWSSGLAR